LKLPAYHPKPCTEALVIRASREAGNNAARKILWAINEGARDMARYILATDEGRASRRQRKKIELLFAHLKRILKLDRLQLRGPCGARDEFHLAATAQNLRKMAKLLTAPAPQPA
jgi:Transposase DDE domain